jgi:hypothetical protein
MQSFLRGVLKGDTSKYLITNAFSEPSDAFSKRYQESIVGNILQNIVGSKDHLFPYLISQGTGGMCDDNVLFICLFVLSNLFILFNML